MNKILLNVASLGFALLTSCSHVSDRANDGTQQFTVSGLTPVSSTSIEGTWVGVADFVDTSLSGLGTYTGQRIYVLQIESHGSNGYITNECRGGHPEWIVDFNPKTNELSTLGRDFIVSNFNEMSGTSTVSFWGQYTKGDESWNWVKVSNTTTNIGTVALEYSSLPGSVAGELKSLCREFGQITRANGMSYSTTESSAIYIGSDGESESLIFTMDPDGSKNMYISHYGLNSYTENEGMAELTENNSSLMSYVVNYSATTSEYRLTADLTVNIPNK